MNNANLPFGTVSVHPSRAASALANNVIGRQVASLNGDVEPLFTCMGGDIPLLPSENDAAYNQKRRLSCNHSAQKQQTSTPQGGKLAKMRGSVGNGHSGYWKRELKVPYEMICII